MKAHQRTVGTSDEWLTPPWILHSLGSFDLDPCAPETRPWPTASTHITQTQDGLAAQWFGRVWLNPPFNRYQRPRWMAKMASHGNGIMLIPAATETDSFKRWVWGAAHAVLFLDRRPHFYDISGEQAKANSGCSICLVAYGMENARALIDSGLGPVVTCWTNPANDNSHPATEG